MKIVTNEEMKEIEKLAATEFGLSEELIIENVGLEGARIIAKDHFENGNYRDEVVIFIGKGNNGADGACIARHLLAYTDRVRIFSPFPESESSVQLKYFLMMAKAYGVKVTEVTSGDQLNSYFSQANERPLVIDALFGTGIRGPFSNLVFDVVNLINRFAKEIIAIDIPTGIYGDTGLINQVVVKATHTLAIGLPKMGLYMADGYKYTGKVSVLRAGLPEQILKGGNKKLLDPKNLDFGPSYRDQFAHKNHFGHVLVIGGSPGLTGAPLLASYGALRVGAGKVTAITWKRNYPELVMRASPEIMTGDIPLEDDGEEVGKALERLQEFDAVVIGPGLGKGKKVKKLVDEVIFSFPKILILDADAINALDFEDEALLKRKEYPTLLTPHVGEFAKLMGVTTNEIQSAPVEYLKKAIDFYHCSFLLKGPCSYLGLTNGKIYFNYFPNDGLATGGSGDVLAGMLGGLASQKVEEEHSTLQKEYLEHFHDTAKLGLVLHSLAGKHAAKKMGRRSMSAGSIINHLPDAFQELEKEKNK